MTRYSTTTLRTPDRKYSHIFTGDVYITGVQGLYDMPEKNKGLHTVFGRDGGFETYGGLKTKTLTMDVEFLVSEHEDIYDTIEQFHLLLSYQNLELYLDPPQRYVKVSYRKDTITEELGYNGVYFKGSIEFDIIDPFWYSETQKMVVANSYYSAGDGVSDGSNYFYSDSYRTDTQFQGTSGFTRNDLGNILYIADTTQKGYYEIVDFYTASGGCYLSTTLNIPSGEDLNFYLYYPPNLTKTRTAILTWSGAVNNNVYSVISDSYLKTYTDYIKVRPCFDGTVTTDSTKMMFTSGLYEIEFPYTTYLTVSGLVDAINAYTFSGQTQKVLTASYTLPDIFGHPLRKDACPSGFYDLAYEPVTSGFFKNILLEDVTFWFDEYQTVSGILNKIDAWRTAGDRTYKLSGYIYDFGLKKSKSIVDSVDYLLNFSGTTFYSQDYLEYTQNAGNFEVGGNYEIYPVIEVTNSGSTTLPGFDIVRYSSGNIEDGRISYFGNLEPNKILIIDTLYKTVREYDIDFNNKDKYINNVYTDRMSKTTATTDFIYLDTDSEMKLLIDANTDNAVDIKFIIKWFDRYI
jgi:hypothetical protein